jgi:hypothetical protein
MPQLTGFIPLLADIPQDAVGLQLGDRLIDAAQ